MRPFVLVLLILVFLTLLAPISCVFSRSVGLDVYYSPNENMVTIEKYNQFLPLGPCGSPWNYFDRYVIVLEKGVTDCQADQIEFYEKHGKAKVQSGRVRLDNSRRRVAVDLTLLEQEGPFQQSPSLFRLNGEYRYVEKDPGPHDVTPGFLRELFSGDKWDNDVQQR